MKILGLIVEYNPFHNGHLYHLNKSKEITNSDYTIGIMSGNFIQRGEPALIDKWTRTQMAISQGVDLIIELPFVYAVSSAESFAFNSIKLLDSLGCVDNICFGSESGDLNVLNKFATILANEPDKYKQYLKNQLSNGISYPEAREKALIEYLQFSNTLDLNTSKNIGFSNNILGIEYLKALIKLNSTIQPFTIKRHNNHYNDENLTGNISSATSIRKAFKENEGILNSEISSATPSECQDIIKTNFINDKTLMYWDNLENILLAKIRSSSLKEISETPYVTEGLENRIKKAGDLATSFEELINLLSTKRYTRTRLQRILTLLIASVTKFDIDNFDSNGGPQYIRVLGFNEKGKSLLNNIKRSASLPVISKVAQYKNSSNPLISKMIEIESLSTDLYVLGYKNNLYKKGGQEFTQNIIKISKDNL